MAMNVNTSMGMENANRMQAPMQQDTDAESRAIRKQIQSKQQELQKLSEDTNMGPKEKMKKRQEIQQEISNLNLQLRQHQMELRRSQQNTDSSTNDLSGRKAKNGTKQNAGLSQTSMEAMISADSSMKQAGVQGSVSTKMEGNARILKSEIRQDAGKCNTEAKEAALVKLEQKAMDAAASQMNSLSDAKTAMEHADTPEDGSRKPESSRENRENKDSIENDTEENKTETQTGDNPETVPENYVAIDVLL